MHFQCIAFDPVVLQKSVLSDMQHSRSGHLNRRATRFCAHEAVVPTGDAPAGDNAIPTFILENLDDIEPEIIDAREEGGDPLLERLSGLDLNSARRDTEVFSDQAINRVRVARLPYLTPELQGDLD